MDKNFRRAILGLFLRDSNNRLLGLTNAHVTQSSDGLFYVSDNGTLVQVGRTITAKRSKSSNATLDIDVLSLETDLEPICINEIFDEHCHKRTFKRFSGRVDQLYGKKVFKCRPASLEDDCNQEAPVLCGHVASADIHLNHRDLFDIQTFFVVDGVDEPFATPGESGTVLAVDLGEPDVYLVGIVCGGQFRGNELLLEKHSVQCLFLGKGIDHLEEKYQTKFDFDVSNEVSKLPAKGQREFRVKSGQTIFFKTPEKIEPLSFNLLQFMITLLTCLEMRDTTEGELAEFKQRETKFSLLLNKRENVEVSITHRGDQYALENGKKACQDMYSHDFTKAEKHLKMAARSVPASNEFKCRLICKQIGYILWFCNESNEDTFQLLKEGKIFMEENDELVAFPRESLGYLYYEFSKYWVKKQQLDKALRKAKQAMDHFQKLDDACPNEETGTRLVLAVCHYAYLLLGCGDTFDVGHITALSSNGVNLTKAHNERSERSVQNMQTEDFARHDDVDNMPTTEGIDPKFDNQTDSMQTNLGGKGNLQDLCDTTNGNGNESSDESFEIIEDPTHSTSEESDCSDNETEYSSASFESVRLTTDISVDTDDDDFLVSVGNRLDKIKVAEEHLEIIKPRLEQTPLVQTLEYEICMCDLHYRKGKYKDALEIAKQCLHKATEKEVEDARKRAEHRVTTLQRLDSH